MTPPAVSAPPPPAAARAAAPAPAPELVAHAPLSRHRAAPPPVLTTRTIGISLGLHLLLLLAVLFAPRSERPGGLASTEGNPSPAESVQYLEVGEWGGMATDPSASLPEPAALPPTGITAEAMDSVIRNLPRDVVFPSRVPAGIPRAAGGPAVTRPGGAQGGVPGGEGAQPAGGAGRGRRSGPGGLGPELGDPRLVVTPTAVPERIPTDEERYQEHFAGQIRRVNDSIAGVAERERRIRDWTITDRNGKKWGINERGPVVNGRNVPLPVPIPVPRSARDREDEARKEREQRRDIDRQADQTERERYLRERGRAIRERNDREREQKGASATPPPAAQGSP